MMTDANPLVAYYELVGAPIVFNGHEYYGVWRSFAQTGTCPWENTPASEVWKDYCCRGWRDMGEWDSFLPTLEAARDFQSRFALHGYHFEIIAIYPCESEEDSMAIAMLPRFLGFDVANTEPNSVVRPEWLWSDVDYRNDVGGLSALWALPPKYFRERINKWGLLSKYEDAVLLRNVMRALERVDPTHQTPEGVRVLGIQRIVE